MLVPSQAHQLLQGKRGRSAVRSGRVARAANDHPEREAKAVLQECGFLRGNLLNDAFLRVARGIACRCAYGERGAPHPPANRRNDRFDLRASRLSLDRDEDTGGASAVGMPSCHLFAPGFALTGDRRRQPHPHQPKATRAHIAAKAPVDLPNAAGTFSQIQFGAMGVGRAGSLQANRCLRRRKAIRGSRNSVPLLSLRR